MCGLRGIVYPYRPLDRLYPILYIDGLVVKVRDNKQIGNKTVYLALGLNDQGHKELLGMWIQQSEGAKIWLNILNELKHRGLEDILIACVDGLVGFPEAIEAVYPQAEVQMCVVHMVRNSLRYVSWQERRAVAQELKGIYEAVNEEAGLSALESLKQAWGSKYPYIAQRWEESWPALRPLYGYPPEIRRAIYTTNAIESLNMSLWKVLKTKRVFPHDQSVLKVLYLAVEKISGRWTMPIKDWKSAMNYFVVKFGRERFRLH